MTEKEARRLQVGDIVRFANSDRDFTAGRVTQRSGFAFYVDWEDGQVDCVVDYRDAERISQ